MRGRKPKPTALKKLAGNPGKRPLNDQEPRPGAPERVPYAPRHLNKDAQREWRRICAVLIELGLYTELDHAALAMYCQAWGLWVTAEREVTEKGEVLVSDKGNFYQNPWRHVANKAWEQMRKMLSEFGLSPAARSRIKVERPEELDPFEEFLQGME